MADIFNRRPQMVNASYSSDDVTMVFGQNIKPLLAQTVGWNYSQAITRLFDLGNADYSVYVASRPQGTLSMAHIVADWGNAISFLTQYADVCNPKPIVLSFEVRSRGGKCISTSGSMTFTSCVISNIAMSVSLADYLLNSNVGILFASALPAAA